MSLNLYVIDTIIKLFNIFNSNNMYLFTGKKIIKVEIPPKHAPKNILFNLTFLFNVIETVNNNKKSYIKLRTNNKSI